MWDAATMATRIITNAVNPVHVRDAALETLYCAQAGALYLAGASDALTQALSHPRKHSPEYSGRAFPILLLHGLAHNQSWGVRMEQALEEAGFLCRSVNYRTIGADITDAATQVSTLVTDTAARHNTDKVHVVSHSLGGLVLRQALTSHPHIAPVVYSATTIGTPHHGTPWISPWMSHAPLLGRICHQIQPGSDYLHTLDTSTTADGVRWVCIWSPDDEVVPGHYGQLTHPHLDITDICLPGVGHAGLMYDHRAVDTVVTQAIRSDDNAMEDIVNRWAHAHSTTRTSRDITLTPTTHHTTDARAHA